MDTWVDSIFRLLWIMLLWTWECRSLPDRAFNSFVCVSRSRIARSCGSSIFNFQWMYIYFYITSPYWALLSTTSSDSECGDFPVHLLPHSLTLHPLFREWARGWGIHLALWGWKGNLRVQVLCMWTLNLISLFSLPQLCPHPSLVYICALGKCTRKTNSLKANSLKRPTCK